MYMIYNINELYGSTPIIRQQYNNNSNKSLLISHT
jgi:hypothetical protein